jgi:hypothetical protein
VVGELQIISGSIEMTLDTHPLVPASAECVSVERVGGCTRAIVVRSPPEMLAVTEPVTIRVDPPAP